MEVSYAEILVAICYILNFIYLKLQSISAVLFDFANSITGTLLLIRRNTRSNSFYQIYLPWICDYICAQFSYSNRNYGICSIVFPLLWLTVIGEAQFIYSRTYATNMFVSLNQEQLKNC